ncbi:MAG: cell division protein FtsZ, partial [Thermoproteota archaeon]|nr:cell division protein FtsZ [Thermoproteota archaeon]
MTFEVKEPVLVIGLGGAGIKLASEMRDILGADSLKISHDKKDVSEHNSIHISTKSIINPSVQLIRGCAMEQSDKIAEHMSTYETVIIMANLAGKSGAALAPVVSSICKEQNKNVLSFAIMP